MQVTSLHGEKEEEKVVLSARPAELWDSEFDRATFHSLLGFRGKAVRLTQQKAICDTCASRFTLTLGQEAAAWLM